MFTPCWIIDMITFLNFAFKQRCYQSKHINLRRGKKLTALVVRILLRHHRILLDQ